MKVVITEKPSVAREIAALLGASQKNEGYLSGNGFFVTWAFGHLVGLALPEDYGIDRFQKKSLPILPNPFLLKVRSVKKNKSFITDPLVLKQLKIIKKLFNLSENIIVATDAGREGELIFRYIYEFLKCGKPFNRLWISSLTEKAILRGFSNLRPGNEFDGLYQAAICRSRADWLVGINASQALCIASGNSNYSLGRVQTPTLALICRRYLENKNFLVQKYCQLQLLHSKDFREFKSISTTKWENTRAAEDILRSIERKNANAVVTLVESKNAIEQPPVLFDLTGLQKEANKRLNLSAEQTLNIAQNLYEQQFITYPRTGSRYIPEDIWTEVPALIRGLQQTEIYRQAAGSIKWGNLNKHIVNELQVTDHHGLLITDKIPSSLPPKENAVYKMIAFRLLQAVSQACMKEKTTITLQVLHHDFSVKTSKIVEPGWRSVTGIFSDENAENLDELPDLKIGDELKIKDAALQHNETKPPVLYTEAGLLSAMEAAGKEIENKDKRRILCNIGIGTPSTRASIIETLLTRNYIRRDKKSLIPTAKGMDVYELIKDKKIASAAMTAEWELILQKIENNSADPEVFQKEMELYAALITEELLQTEAVKMDLPDLNCPKCKQQLSIRDNIVKCPSNTCNWLQFRNICGVKLSILDLESLINTGRTSLIEGMKSKAGKKFDAYIILNDTGESSFEFKGKK